MLAQLYTWILAPLKGFGAFLCLFNPLEGLTSSTSMHDPKLASKKGESESEYVTQIDISILFGNIKIKITLIIDESNKRQKLF